jgi:Tfp pilus assembly protein PilN
MYTPEINFLKERTLTATTGQFTAGGVAVPVAPSRGGSTAIIIGLLIAGVSLGAYAWGNFQLTSRLTALRLDRDEINRDLSEAQSELSRRQALQTELDGLLARTNAFQSFFVSLQPWSAILQDVRNRVPPDVWVSNLSTTANTVTIQGQSLEFEQVNDFILTLKQSPYVQNVQLNNTQEVAGSADSLPSVNYGLTITLANLQLSTPETLDVLRAQGALGVVEKLTILRELEIN